MELVDLEESKVIGKGVIPELNVPGILSSYELAFNLAGVRFEHKGKYDFRIYAGEDMFGNKTFNVIEVIPPQIQKQR